MMKKQLKFLITMLMLAFSLPLFAAEQIRVLWAFDIASNQASTLRKLLDVANSEQSEFVFVLDNRKGAGGSIAANEVTKYPNNTIVGMSSSFFLRPLIEKEGTHNLSDFTPVLVQASGTPLVMVTKNNFVLSKKEITIGISGYGTIGHLFAANFQKDSGINVIIVPYKSNIDAYVAVMGGFVDAAPVFPGDVGLPLPSNISIFSYTGDTNITTEPYLNAKSFSALNFSNVKRLTVNYGIFSSVKMNSQLRSKLTSILEKANTNAEVLEYYKRDFLIPSNSNVDNIKWYRDQITHWTSATAVIKIPE
jgi:tripartite-type tricarboxylate transporter receptor subunit TctC